MFDPPSAEPSLAKLTMGDLMKRRGEVERNIAAIEAAWVDASEALERAA
jgi:ATP-binding cassette subfamily F protein 3